MLAIVATCDLVRILNFLFQPADDFLQPFRFIERPAVRGFITYLNPKLQDTDVPKKSCIAEAVDAKVAQLEEITLEIVEVCFIRHLLLVANQHIAYPVKSVYRMGWLVHS